MSKLTFNGSRRQCTDLLPLACFFAFWCGMVLVAAFAILRGDAFRIVNGVDSFGNTCGRKNMPLVLSANSTTDPVFFPLSGQDMTDKKFLFPLDIRHPFNSTWICVNVCPNRTVASNFVEFHTQTNYSYCSAPVGLDGVSRKRYCPIGTIYESDGSILSRCIPNDILAMAIDMLSSLHEFIRDQDWLREVVEEVLSVRAEIGALCLLSVGLSLIGVFLIRFLAPVIVYFIYIVVILLATGFSSALWYGWYTAYSRNETSLVTKIDAQELIALPELSPQTLAICAVPMSIITVLLFAAIWCVWPRGALVVDLFHEAGRALAAMPFLLLQPLLTCAIIVAFVAYWAVIAVYLYTSAPPMPSVIVRSNGEVIDAVTFNVTDEIRYMGWYHFVGLIWTTEFVFACHRMVVAGAVATWYFKRKASSPCCSSLSNLIGYHLGSVALGSFIITLVKLPRYVLMYIHAKLKESNNFIAKYILRCMIVLLRCVEGCLRYIHHNAYTVIAINGQSFWPAARMAVNVLLDNAVDVATINTVGDFVLFLAKCIVATACLAVAIFRFKFQLALNYWMIAAGIVAIVAYISASCFLSVIEMVIDTLFLCFAHDNDNVTKSNGSEDYADVHFKEYMSATLDRERALGATRRWRQSDRKAVEEIELSNH
uniref:Choline transporter-like protein n=1 Tax=Ascaris suum TaxID=6253 RepID=F1KTR1_ASCSU